jgi:hypothetical protein
MGARYGRGNIFYMFTVTELIKRTIEGAEGSPQPLGVFFYLNQLIIILPVCIPLIGAAIWSAIKNRESRSDRTFLFQTALLMWIIFYFLGFTMISTRITWYLLPVFPPIVLLAGIGLTRLRSQSLSHGGILTIAGIMGLAAIWAANFDFRQNIKHMSIPDFIFFPTIWTILIEVIILLSIIAILYTSPGKILRIPILIFVPLAAVALIHIAVLDRWQYNDGAKELAEVVEMRGIKNITVVGNGDNPQLTYYLGGIELGWKEGYTWRRLDLWRGVGDVRNNLEQLPAEHSMIIIEKDEIRKGIYSSEHDVLPKPFEKILDTKEYAAYIWQ